MGCSVRDKHVRTNRRPRSVKSEFDPCCHQERASLHKSVLELGSKPLDYHIGLDDSNQINAVTSNSNSSSNLDDGGWGYCTEDQLEEILMKNLQFVYTEAISKLVALGYDEDTAMNAILHNGHCYGSMDVLTNVLHNSLSFLNGDNNSDNLNSEVVAAVEAVEAAAVAAASGDGIDIDIDIGNCNGYGYGIDIPNVNANANLVVDDPEPVFSDLRQLQEYSLAGMVCLLQQVRPHLTKGDAMWCLLMSDLHVGRASAMEVPVLPSAPSNVNGSASGANGENVSNQPVGFLAPSLCKFHSGSGFGNGGGSEFSVNRFVSYAPDMNLHRDIECPKRFNLSPSMKSLLKRNVAAFAAGFRANSKNLQVQSQACTNGLPSENPPVVQGGSGFPVEKSEENQDAVNLMLSKFRDLKLYENLDFVAEDQKDEVIVNLLQQIKELERQVKERKEWAHQKAMQAARKLSNDLTELKMLRMEREETQCLKKGKQSLEDTTMKRLSEMENALKKASGQVDRANAAVRRLEIENAEIRAEMEALKLSASESVTTCLEVAKREKKSLKRLLAWEKQKTKLQEQIAEEKDKISKLQDQLEMIKLGQKEAEVRWRQEVNAKEAAMAQVEDERRSKEAAEASSKRKLEALRLKIEIDFQRHKDDLQRLEQELLRLKASAQSTESHHPSNNNTPKGNSDSVKPQGETIAKMLRELDSYEDSSEKDVNQDRDCIICKRGEVSIVFLPCAHQVLCASCSDNYGKKGRATCPCCRVTIEQRIRVFGASS
ncbi:MND1-interacting protein 1 [Cucumis melo var. makuwa]|uniref:MND1-interacting protein 1 n=2 Tax=Cucumis melo TaxID=3656 RepID=A0A5D3CMQ8_CUCMM|nr:MND1-interacting protein 1 [Cucumis melo var. makuwa]TYK11509.1 MND1-interacting protein 1 [Cucumis melo var. makuwa]